MSESEVVNQLMDNEEVKNTYFPLNMGRNYYYLSFYLIRNLNKNPTTLLLLQFTGPEFENMVAQRMRTRRLPDREVVTSKHVPYS